MLHKRKRMYTCQKMYMQENFDSCFCVRDSANTQISKLSGAWKESRTMLEGLMAPNAHLIPLKKEDTVCCFTLLPSIKKTRQPNGATFSSHGSRPCWMGFGWCGIQGRSSLIGLGESWDCSWGEAVGWIGAWPVAEQLNIISDQTGSVMNEEANLQQRPGRSAGLALLCYSNGNISMQILKARYFSVCIHM